ncbi:MAG: B12-binding domain-containing protein, partial [Caldilineales bacterium]|nr:B12-binding domain-containing protein [Caldilineales bacterium]
MTKDEGRMTKVFSFVLRRSSFVKIIRRIPMAVLDELRQCVIEGDAPKTQALVKQAMSEGVPAEKILNEGLIAAMAEVGRLFEQGEYFVPEMLVSARAMKGGLELLRPALAAANVQAIGKVVIGTVQGDLHDIG